MHVLGTITDKTANDANPTTITVQPLFGHDNSTKQTFVVNSSTKIALYNKTNPTFSDLANGMRVEVEAHKDTTNNTLIADHVNVIPPPPAAVGKVTKVGDTSFDLRVERRNGRTINVDANTHFILPNNTDGAFSDLKVGDQVQVWSASHTNAEDDTPAPITATVVRIMRHAPPPPPPPTVRPFDGEGVVSDLHTDTTPKTFTLTGEHDKKFLVQYTDSTQIILPSSTAKLDNGVHVVVVGTVNPASATSTPPVVSARVIVVVPHHDDEP